MNTFEGHTPGHELYPVTGDLDVSVLDNGAGAMVVQPKRSVVAENIAAGKPFSSRRVAMLQSGPYLRHDECVRYARQFAESDTLLRQRDALLAACKRFMEAKDSGGTHALVNAITDIRSAIDLCDEKDGDA